MAHTWASFFRFMEAEVITMSLPRYIQKMA